MRSWAPLVLAAMASAQIMRGLNHLRFGCSQITIERLDPLVNPGQVATPHMHQVVGGNAFNASMPSADIGALATCTTCGPADDFSNYWTANLYFRARNGSYKRVKQVPNRYVVGDRRRDDGGCHSTTGIPQSIADVPCPARFLFNDRFTTQTAGGITVYYISPGKGQVTAFKPVSVVLVRAMAHCWHLLTTNH